LQESIFEISSTRQNAQYESPAGFVPFAQTPCRPGGSVLDDPGTSLEQFLQGIDQQAPAKVTGAREKVEPSLPDHLPDQGRLVDMVAAIVPEAGK